MSRSQIFYGHGYIFSVSAPNFAEYLGVPAVCSRNHAGEVEFISAITDCLSLRREG